MPIKAKEVLSGGWQPVASLFLGDLAYFSSVRPVAFTEVLFNV